MPSRLTWYAELPARRRRQIGVDVLVLVWVVAWALIGTSIYSRIKTSAEGAGQLEAAGREFSSSMAEAGGRLSQVPLVGEDVQQPFNRAATAGNAVAQAGRDLQVGVEQLGLLLGLLTAALPIALVGAFWFQSRLSYARQVRMARSVEAFSGPQIDAVRGLLGLDHQTLGLRPVAVPGPGGTGGLPTVSTTGGLSAVSPGQEQSDRQ